jgi:chemotaxis protein CheD
VRLVVGVADLKVSPRGEDQLVTHALGSCLGITLYDPVARVGGLLHAMLPWSTLAPARAASNPAMFIDTGVAELLRRCRELGAAPSRVEVIVAGGARVSRQSGNDLFRIGERNAEALDPVLAQNGLRARRRDLGGLCSRNVLLDVATGRVTITASERVPIAVP